MRFTQIPLVLTILFVLAIPADAQNYDSLVTQALELRNAGDMAGSEQLLRQAYDVADNKSEAAYLLALVLAYQEKFEEAEALLRKSLAAYPDNFELQLTRARIQSYQGLFTQAGETVEKLLVKDPYNTDALNLSGRIFLYKKQYVRGREKFLRVLESDSSNLDALIGIYDCESHLGNNKQADIYLSRAERIAPGNADVLARKSNRAATDGPWHQLVASVDASQINRNNIGNWHEQSIEYRHGHMGENQQYLRFQHANRFSLDDYYWETGASFRNQGFIPLNVSIGFGTRDIFLPKQRFRLGTEFNLHKRGTDFGAIAGYFSYQHSRYSSGTVKQGFIDIEYYLMNTNAWIAPGAGITNDENSESNFGFRVAWHHQITSQLRYGLSYSDAPETENSITTDTQTYHGYLRYRLSDSVIARIDYARNRREASYTRDSLSLTLDYRF